MTAYCCPKCDWRIDTDDPPYECQSCGATPLLEIAADCPTMRRLGDNPFFVPLEKQTKLRE
jgi:rubredoxin